MAYNCISDGTENKYLNVSTYELKSFSLLHSPSSNKSPTEINKKKFLYTK